MAAARPKMKTWFLWWLWLCPLSLFFFQYLKSISAVASERQMDTHMWITDPESSL